VTLEKVAFSQNQLSLFPADILQASVHYVQRLPLGHEFHRRQHKISLVVKGSRNVWPAGMIEERCGWIKPQCDLLGPGLHSVSAVGPEVVALHT
jgi:hypothetical protein